MSGDAHAPSHTDVLGALKGSHQRVLGHVDELTRSALTELKEHRHLSSHLLSSIDRHHVSTQKKLDVLLRRPASLGSAPAVPRQAPSGWGPHRGEGWFSFAYVRRRIRGLSRRRRRVALAALAAALLLVLLIGLLVGLLIRSEAAAPVIERARAEAVTTLSGPLTGDGSVGVDIVVRLDGAAQLAYAVLPAAAVVSLADVSAADVWQAARVGRPGLLAPTAVACGSASVPVGGRDFVLSVYSAIDTTECASYLSLTRSTLDGWAGAAQCLRCPRLEPVTYYEVRPSRWAASSVRRALRASDGPAPSHLRVCSRQTRRRRRAQVAVVASRDGKLAMRVLRVRTGDTAPPRFVQPPVVQSAETGLAVTFAVDKTARLDWAIAYDEVSAEFRDQRLGFKSSTLSTAQVLAASSIGAAAASAPAALRRLRAADVPSDVGPVIAAGSTVVGVTSSPLAVQLMTPCLEGTGMCEVDSDALSPVTPYKVRARKSRRLCPTTRSSAKLLSHPAFDSHFAGAATYGWGSLRLMRLRARRTPMAG